MYEKNKTWKKKEISDKLPYFKDEKTSKNLIYGPGNHSNRYLK